jgi:hypothetical protein
MLSWLMSASLAIAAPACTPVDHAAWMEGVRKKGAEAAYLCLAADATAAAPLIAAIAAVEEKGSGQQRRLQRALALHVMQRLDQPADLDALRALNASDLRLLRDAVHARRGRPSPVKEHEAVFQKFDWYQPDRRFTNRDLTDLDRANLVVIDKPPRAESPVTEDDAPALAAVPKSEAAGPKPANTAGGCGCAASASPVGGAFFVVPLLVAVSLRRRASPA